MEEYTNSKLIKKLSIDTLSNENLIQFLKQEPNETNV